MAGRNVRAIDEQALVAAARRGDVTTFNELLRIHQDLMFNVAYLLLDDREAAGDAVQAAAVSAFKAVRHFRGDSSRSWLLRIVTHRCYDELRARRRRSTHPAEPRPEANRLPTLPCARELPAQHPGRGHQVQLVERAVLTLQPQQRVILILSDVHGLSYQEIAAALQMSRDTVQSRLSQARMQLRDTLQGNNPTPRTL
ncbi:MAG TPA: RNA polymerase sigma factor [Anaerolineae bacterium]|nr:RNA polymerase sigma factor [Anaerolineae bacterium]